MITDKSPAEIAFDEVSERLNQPEETGPKYLSVAPPTNHAMRREAKLAQRRRARRLETWKRQLDRVGINWEDVLAERLAKMKERVKIDVRPAGEADGDTAQDTPAA